MHNLEEAEEENSLSTLLVDWRFVDMTLLSVGRCNVGLRICWTLCPFQSRLLLQNEQYSVRVSMCALGNDR